MTASPAGELTAFRKIRGSRATVVVQLDGATIDELGGKRAERAEAVIVTVWPREDRVRVWGLRQDHATAASEAHRLVHATTMRTRGKYGRAGVVIPLNTATWAVAVPVLNP